MLVQEASSKTLSIFKEIEFNYCLVIWSNQMDRSMYTAAMEGRQVDYLRHNKHVNLEDAVTPNGNTLLHVTALFGAAAAAECVNVIVKSCPSLLTRANLKGETPLHIASREGHFEVVLELITSAKALEEELESGFGGAANTKKMLRLTSDNGDTALHKALRYRHVAVVKLLVEEEDPEFSHTPNKARETPLYLAAEKGLEDCVKVILKTCTSPSYSGPGSRTALHAAVIFGSEGSTMELLSWKPYLANVADQSGWTPLHCAASFGHVQRARQLLDLHTSVAYATTENDEKNTALHIATKRGHVEIVTCIISEYPTCADLVNGKGQNVLHVAAENKQHEVIKFILQSPFLLTRSLINQEDNEGNTPLHLLAASGYYLSDLAMHPKAEIMVFNNNNLTPLDIAYKLVEEGNTQSSHILEEWKRVGAVPCLRCGIEEFDNDQNSRENPATNLVSQDTAVSSSLPSQDRKRERQNTAISVSAPSQDGEREREMERLWRQVDVRMVVAALIVTVTFTAGFTMPGGFIGNDGPTQGLAALTRLAAFRAFVISDALSLILSSIALVIYFLEVGDFKQKDLENFGAAADLLTSFAILAMMVAFMTGTYAVLVHSLGLAITTNVLCSSFFIFFFSLYYCRARS